MRPAARAKRWVIGGCVSAAVGLIGSGSVLYAQVPSTEILQGAQGRSDATWIVAVVLILVGLLFAGVGAYVYVVTKWIGANVVVPGRDALVNHLTRLEKHMDSSDESHRRTTEAIETLASSLGVMPKVER